MSLGKKGKKNIILALIVVCFVLVCVMIYVKKHSEPQMENRIFENPFAGVNEEIDWQSGNYANEALEVDGYIYLYKSRVELGMHDHLDDLEKCGNNVIYRLSPDGTYEEFYTFDYGDAIYYAVNSKLYYYAGYFYIQIENRIYRINKDGTDAQVIYEDDNGYDCYRTFGIRDHYLLIASLREIYYVDLDTWDWSKPMQFGNMRRLIGVHYDFDVESNIGYFYEDIIYGTGTEEPEHISIDGYGKQGVHNVSVYDENGEKQRIADHVYCINTYKGNIFYAQRVDDSVSIKYKSLESDDEGEVFTVPLKKSCGVVSLAINDNYIIYDIGAYSNYGYQHEVLTRVIWNRQTGEIQQTIEY